LAVVGKLYRIIYDLIIYRPQSGVAQCGVAAIACAENDARRRDALIDRRLCDAESPRDLFGGPVIEKEVEAGAMFLGQSRPALGVVSKKTMRIVHVDTFVKKMRLARFAIGGRRRSRKSARAAFRKIDRSHPISWDGEGGSNG
jgi:hypothetical protein